VCDSNLTYIDDDIIMNNKVQPQSNEPTSTKDSTVNEPFVNILTFSLNGNFENFFATCFYKCLQFSQ
jgi:hypothetical protein